MIQHLINRIGIIRPTVLKQVRLQVYLRRLSRSEVKMEATKTLKEFGYGFNAAGQLRKLNESGEPGDEQFLFNVSNKHHECQAHYEALGSAITEHVYQLLENQEKLIKLPVPKAAKDGTFIFVSKDYEKKDVLLVLIHGSGVVRAGQWARSLIINESLQEGSQIPYIQMALKKDYGVLIMNTNDNFTADGDVIPNSETAEGHAQYVWDTYVKNTKASSIFIVAHSYGGVVTVALADKKANDFEGRVKAVAFTDSVHGFANIKITEHLKKITRNWVSSSEPLDTAIKTPEHDMPRVSAGHQKHEMTSYSCMESVFKYFDEKLK